MPEQLRAVLVGCGSVAGAWLTALKELEGVDVVGLADIDEDAALRRKEEFGLTDAVTAVDFESLLDALKPDVVFDCTVPEAHIDVTLAALGRGIHVLGEKPLADSMENARRMVAAARQSGRIYAVIQNRRYDRNIRAFAGLVQSGRIGRITTLNSDFYIGAHFGGFRDHMEHVLLVDMAIHTFDAARFISGADPVAVYCHEWNPPGSWFNQHASAVAVFEMTDGVVYTYRGSWCAEGLNTTWESDWRAVCERGSAVWDGADGLRAQAVKQTGGFFSELEDVPVPRPPDAGTAGHKSNIEEFLRCVRTGGTPETVCTDNIKSLAMVFAAVESARTGARVRVEM